MNIKERIRYIHCSEVIKKYIGIFLIFGILLMTFPTGEKSENITKQTESEFSLEKEEERLEKILSQIKGVSKCDVLLSVGNGSELILAENEGEPIIVSNGSDEEPITVLERYPIYRGAIVVIGGYSDANIRFDVLSAIMSYTGLGTDKITICPIEE